MTNKLKYNISYSAWSTYKKSQLQFYFQYIKKAKKTNDGYQVYGDAGNVVHKALESDIKKSGIPFGPLWYEKYKIDEQTGIRGAKLDFETYHQCYKRGEIIIQSLNVKLQAELEINQIIFGTNFKSIIDLIYPKNNIIHIRDWKTDSSGDYNKHKDQRLFYSWMIWKKVGCIPKCRWEYLKFDNLFFEDQFSIEEMEKFDKVMEKFVNDLREKGDNINKYHIGNYRNPFNQYYNLCYAEEQRRKEQKNEITDLDITFNIRGNFVFIESEIPKKLEDGIDFKTRFDLPNKFWMGKTALDKAKKEAEITGLPMKKVNLEEIGRVHLYNKGQKCFPIGLLDDITKICQEYGNFFKKEVKIFLKDSRDQKILNYRSGTMPEKLKTDKELRDYQGIAAEYFLQRKMGIINLPTGTGKTFLGAEIVRRVDGKTLWICDRKELLMQTKKELEDLLGQEIGIIADGKVDVKQITIATIQSLYSRINDLIPYLSQMVNFVVVDEMHKSAADTYQKVFAKLAHTKYRLGLTATVMRDDGKEKIFHSILGDVIFRKSTQEMIDAGYIMRPTIEFHLVSGNSEKMKYTDDYKKNIVNNKDRNQLIASLIPEDKKVLILVKMISHGKWLSENMDIPFIHGSLDKNMRNQYFKEFKEAKSDALIMTQSIASEGLNIQDLDIIINCAANKGCVKSIQTIGRVLRIFEGKKEAKYIDFKDVGFYTKKHSDKRINAFINQGHEVKEI